MLNVPGSCEESVSVSMGLPVVYMSLGMYLPGTVGEIYEIRLTTSVQLAHQ